MKNRERILATVKGDEVDRFPVWLKLGNVWYESQPEPYCSMDIIELLRGTGCDLLVGNGIKVQKENPHVDIHHVQEGNETRTTYETPDGILTSEVTYEPSAYCSHPTRHHVNSRQELEAVRWLFKDTSYGVDPNEAEETCRRQVEFEAEDIFTYSGIGPGPLMDMVEHLAGPVNTIYLLQDYPELFNEVLELMHQDRIRELEAKLPAYKADMLWMSENTSTTLISPALFKQYCMPHLREYGEMILGHDIIPVHHMCGTLNALLEDIDKLPAPVNEAFTTPPVGDCTLAEGRTRMPSKALIGGTNATLLTQSLEKIEQTLVDDLARCPDKRKIFLTSAGVLPPPVSFEKAGKITDIMKNMPTK